MSEDEVTLDLRGRDVSERDMSDYVRGRADEKGPGDVVPLGPGRWQVWGNSPSPYVVVLGDGWRTCSCPHGQHAGGDPRCHHVVAALRARREQEEGGAGA